MHKDWQALCDALESLARDIIGTGNAQPYIEAHGWFAPAVTRDDLAGIARRIVKDLSAAAPEDLDATRYPQVADFPRRLESLRVNTLPHFWNSNAGQAIPAFMTTMAVIRETVNAAIGWQTIDDPKVMPAQLAKRARSLNASLEQIELNVGSISEQVNVIKEAHAAAIDLPVELGALAHARRTTQNHLTEIEDAARQALETRGRLGPLLHQMEVQMDIAEKIVAQCEVAYRITSTKGLAASFAQRSLALNLSIIAWVIGLLIALAAGSYIGSIRLEALSLALRQAEGSFAYFAFNLIASILSVGAPIWFAWMATKQIGQRFRLAEDYGFKAAVAKAYEGYRKEAARIDPAFEARLFSSALTRLEEAPLRLVDGDTHGSPWHEFFASPQFREAMNTIPELKDKFIEIAEKGANAVASRIAPKSKAEPVPSADPESPSTKG